MLPPPIDFRKWIEDNRHLLKPPVGNKCIVAGDFYIMIVGGPNLRTDYHVEEGPEFFHQIEGEMILRIQELDHEGRGIARDIPIKAGEIFYLPPRVPHSPQRMVGGIGLVIERRRLAHEQDGLQWYCQDCNHKIYEECFHLHDIEHDFPPVFERFYRSIEHRTCGNCGAIHPRPAHFEDDARLDPT